MDACSRCHTGHGVNSITGHLHRLLGDAPWTPDVTTGFIENMHEGDPFMPPFPGNKEDLRLLGEYLQHLQENWAPIPGAQEAGIIVNPEPSSAAVGQGNTSHLAAQ